MYQKEFYTVREVAQILALSPDRIYEYLRSGHLHGARLTRNSAWRIPANELQRLKGINLEKSSAQIETKLGKWSEYIEIAVQLQNSLSHIGPKDWAIWGLLDRGEPPLTSEAKLKIWVDRGKLMIKLAVEQEPCFLLFLCRLKVAFPVFEEYDKWKDSLRDFIDMCWAVVHEIWWNAENETGLNLSRIPVMGKGHLLNVPKFIYESALDNYASDNRPDLAILEGDANHHKLVPKDYPNYILAVGSRDEITRCEEATMSLSNEYTKDRRVGEIKARAIELRGQTEPFLIALSTILKEAIGDS